MIELVTNHIIPAAYSLLPSKMNNNKATAMLVAIALQESKLIFRRQVNGPARSLWQFEQGLEEKQSGLAGVRIHDSVERYYKELLTKLLYHATLSDYEVHRLIEHNDILACGIARLLLWTVPAPLPNKLEYDLAWGQYIAGWNPGRPHRNTWNNYYDTAWKAVENRMVEQIVESRKRKTRKK